MKIQKMAKLFTLLFVFGVIAGGFQTASAQAKKKKIVYYSIKAGTVFHVRLESKLSSKTSKVGDTFRTTTRDPIYSANGVELVPSGSTIYGRVASAIPAKKDGKPGSIDVRFTSIKLTERPIRRHQRHAGFPR